MTAVSRTVSFHHIDGGAPSQPGAMDLIYDTDRPFEVAISFGAGEASWDVWRSVLAGDIDGRPTVHVDGRVIYGGFGYEVDGMYGYLTLAGASDGQPHAIVLRCLAAPVRAFLALTAQLVPYGAENLDFDAELDALLKDGAR